MLIGNVAVVLIPNVGQQELRRPASRCICAVVADE
jgi:hypothetical protein